MSQLLTSWLNGNSCDRLTSIRYSTVAVYFTYSQGLFKHYSIRIEIHAIGGKIFEFCEESQNHFSYQQHCWPDNYSSRDSKLTNIVVSTSLEDELKHILMNFLLFHNCICRNSGQQHEN